MIMINRIGRITILTVFFTMFLFCNRLLFSGTIHSIYRGCFIFRKYWKDRFAGRELRSVDRGDQIQTFDTGGRNGCLSRTRTFKHHRKREERESIFAIKLLNIVQLCRIILHLIIFASLS